MANPFGMAEVSIPALIGIDMQMKQNRLEQLYRQKQMQRSDQEWDMRLKDQARKDKEYDRQEKTRARMVEAYNPTTGQIDPAKARGVFLENGDVEGAMQFDKTAAAQRKAQLETAQTQLEMTAKLLGGVKDAQSFAAARAQAQAMGMDVSNVPETYDPAWVERTGAQALDMKDRIRLELDRSEFEERKRHNRASEGVAAGNLDLSRQRESRVAKWGPQPLIGVVGGVKTNTDDLGY